MVKFLGAYAPFHFVRHSVTRYFQEIFSIFPLFRLSFLSINVRGIYRRLKRNLSSFSFQKKERNDVAVLKEHYIKKKIKTKEIKNKHESTPIPLERCLKDIFDKDLVDFLKDILQKVISEHQCDTYQNILDRLEKKTLGSNLGLKKDIHEIMKSTLGEKAHASQSLEKITPAGLEEISKKNAKTIIEKVKNNAQKEIYKLCDFIDEDSGLIKRIEMERIEKEVIKEIFSLRLEEKINFEKEGRLTACMWLWFETIFSNMGVKRKEGEDLCVQFLASHSQDIFRRKGSHYLKYLQRLCESVEQDPTNLKTFSEAITDTQEVFTHYLQNITWKLTQGYIVKDKFYQDMASLQRDKDFKKKYNQKLREQADEADEYDLNDKGNLRRILLSLQSDFLVQRMQGEMVSIKGIMREEEHNINANPKKKYVERNPTTMTFLAYPENLSPKKRKKIFKRCVAFYYHKELQTVLSLLSNKESSEKEKEMQKKLEDSMLKLILQNSDLEDKKNIKPDLSYMKSEIKENGLDLA